MGWSAMISNIADALAARNTEKQLVERRSHFRVPCRRSVNVILDSRAIGGHMVNLSPKGMKVRVTDPLPESGELRLVVAGKKGGQATRFVASIDLVCRVIWTRWSPVHAACDVGLAYVPAPGVDLEYVDAFFRHELGLEDFATYQKRTSRRVPTELDVTCFTPDGRVTLGEIRDLSLQGALFEGALRVDEGNEVRLRVDVDKVGEPLYCVGTVVRCTPAHRADWFETGVSFTEVGDRARLKAIIARELRAREGTQ